VESIEASSKSVDEAVQQARARLAKQRDEVEITVLQDPARGTIGLGSREARVRVAVRPSSAVITPEMADAILGPASAFPEEEAYGEEEEDLGEYEEEDEGEFDEAELEDEVQFLTPAGQVDIIDHTPIDADLTDHGALEGEMQEVETPSREDVEITVDVLQQILHYMNIRAAVQVRSTNPLTLNIQGINENLGLLIGRRGETLSALQLLVSLIVGHRTKHRMRIIVDAENYRERREENLRSLALRVAQQVRNYRRSIALEAMPPHERRIVHIALADSKDISTESIGEGEARRVVISLKRSGR